jgi:hypothetical protein
MILGGTFTGFVTRCLLLLFGYKSFQAIETTAWKDDAHWLTFWLLYSVIQFIEYFLDYVLSMLPLYYELKLALYVYLGLFGGATTVYEAIGKRAIQAAEVQIQAISNRPEVKSTYDKVVTEKERLMGHMFKKKN